MWDRSVSLVTIGYAEPITGYLPLTYAGLHRTVEGIRPMALTTPLVKLTKFALDSVLHPIERTKETAAIGKMIVGQVTRAAATVAVDVVTGDKSPEREAGPATRSPADLHAVPPVADPGAPAAPRAAPVARPAGRVPAKKTPSPPAAKKYPSTSVPAKKAAPSAAPAPADKGPVPDPQAPAGPARKAAAKKTSGPRKAPGVPPAKKATRTPAARKATETPAAKKVVEAPAKTAAETPAVKKTAEAPPAKKATPAPVTEVDAQADPSAVTVTPADIAKVVSPETPSSDGTTASVAAPPEPEPMLDVSAAKAVRSESETLQKAADPDKG
jgi:hypothetical protein